MNALYMAPAHRFVKMRMVDIHVNVRMDSLWLSQTDLELNTTVYWTARVSPTCDVIEVLYKCTGNKNDMIQ